MEFSFRKEQEQKIIEKYEQQREESTVLSEQIAHRPPGPPSRFEYGNLFARDESPEENYRKQCAKEIAESQLHAIEWKREQARLEKLRKDQEMQQRLNHARLL